MIKPEICMRSRAIPNEVVEALSNILATGFNDAGKAAEAVDLLAGAVVKFPETMKIESLADSLQETIAAGEATGQFSELLTRLGVDVDKFNERLGKTSSSASRQTLVLQTLRNEGLGTLWESYKEGNETMIEAEKANYELQLRYAELAKSIEPIETKIKSTFAQVLLEHEDQILAIVDAAGAILGVGVDIIAFLSQLNPAVVLIGGGLAVVALKAAGTALGMQIMAKGTAAATTTLAIRWACRCGGRIAIPDSGGRSAYRGRGGVFGDVRHRNAHQRDPRYSGHQHRE